MTSNGIKFDLFNTFLRIIRRTTPNNSVPLQINFEKIFQSSVSFRFFVLLP